MSRRNLRSYLAVAALAITTACSGPAEGPPDAGPDAGGPPEADAAPVEDAAVDAAPDAAPDAPPDAPPPPPDELTAIVELSNCSGSVVRLRTSQPTDHALVLTNGHCIGGGFLDPGEAVAGRPSTRRMNVLEPDALVPGPPMGPPPDTGVRVAVQASELVYATMTTTDMALYRLTITYGELENDHGVHAMTIIDRHPDAGTAILVPSGYWHALFACSIDAFVYGLREGGWMFEDSIRYTQPGCETIGGTSGSPIVATATHEVIGINNTANEGGTACSVNNPCEVDARGHTMSFEDGRYGQQIYLLYGCLSPTNELDFDLPGCHLPRPTP